MTISTMLAIYFGGALPLLAYMAALNFDQESARETFVICLLWPLGYVLIVVGIFIAMLESRGWKIDVREPREGLSGWGFRRREKGGPGWAVRCPWLELLVWKRGEA